MIGVMVLQNGVMQADCLRICRSLSTVLQGWAEWWQWGAHLSAHCLMWLQSQVLWKRAALSSGGLLSWAGRALARAFMQLCQLTQASPLCLVQQHSSEHSPPTLIILNVVIILMTVFHFFFSLWWETKQMCLGGPIYLTRQLKKEESTNKIEDQMKECTVGN